MQIPQEIEDDPQEYEGEVDDAPSEDFDDEEDEEGGIAFPEGTCRCMRMPNCSDILPFETVFSSERETERERKLAFVINVASV